MRSPCLGVTWAVNGTLVVQAIVLVVWFRLRFHRYTGTRIVKLAESVAPPPTTESLLEASRTQGLS